MVAKNVIVIVIGANTDSMSNFFHLHSLSLYTKGLLNKLGSV
jgi:hypothetical protein